MAVRQVGQWVDDELPRLNRAILAREIPPGMLADQAREVLFPQLPVVDGLTPGWHGTHLHMVGDCSDNAELDHGEARGREPR